MSYRTSSASRSNARLAAMAIAILTTAFLAWSQDATGRVTGKVTDPAGASVAGAKVVVTNTGTSSAVEATTGEDGTYQVLNLPIGDYTVSVQREGFGSVRTQPNQLTINQTLRIDVHLTLGAVSQTVAVEAQASQVETINPTVGGTVTGAPIANLPLNGRNTLDLALTQPGVVPAPTVSYVAGTFTVAGGRPDEVTFLLDGGNNNTVTTNGANANPNPDMIAEFRILSNNYTAEYGHSGGGVVSVVTKSGTNDLHGSLYEYLRNDDLNASDYFSNAAGLPRPVLKRNQFGGTFGGPVVIPKVFHGKDKMFFFFGYQGQRLVQTQVNPQVTVFTPAELTGDFSHAVKGGPDPNVAKFLQKNPYFQPNPQLTAQAIISPTAIDPVAQAYIKNNLLPVSPTGLLVPTASAANNADEYNAKGDYNITNNDHLSLTLAYSKNPSVAPFGGNVAGYPGQNLNRTLFGNITYTKAITANLLSEAHMTVQHNDAFKNTPIGNAPKFPALGINIATDGATGPTNLSFSSGASVGYNANFGQTADTTYSYSENLTWVHGRHTFKGGASFAAVQDNSYFLYGSNGNFSFTTTYPGGSGNDQADFLFGLPSSFGETPGAYSNIRSKQYGVFFQDEWKITPRLVLTLGLRYEYNTPLTDPHGRTFNFIPGIQSKVFTNAPLGLVFPGDPGAPTGQYFPDRNDFQPRFGFAWDPFGSGKTSVRGGFGIFNDVLRAEQDQWNNGAPPFFSAASLPPFTGPTGTITGPLTYLSHPYETAGVPDPFPSTPPPSNLDFAAKGYIPFAGGIGDWVNPNLRTPYIYQYNLNVQQQLGRSLVAEVGYIGNDSHKLLSYMDEDPTIIGTAIRVRNTLPGVASNAYRSANTVDNIGKSHYNGMLASLTKRFSDVKGFGNVFFTASYTYSHAIDNVSGWQEVTTTIPFYNHNAFYGNSDFDIRQRFVLSGGWELPFAKAWSSGPKKLTTGWSLFPIFTDQTGRPLNITAGLRAAGLNTPGPAGDGNLSIVHPNLVGSSVQILDPSVVQTINGKTGHFYFSPNNFSVPAIWSSATYIPTAAQVTEGTLPRNSIFGPGVVNFNLSLEKKTDFLGEKLKTQFRAEFFNVLNHTEFAAPVVGLTSGTFGQITSVLPDSARVIQLALRLMF